MSQQMYLCACIFIYSPDRLSKLKAAESELKERNNLCNKLGAEIEQLQEKVCVCVCVRVRVRM